MDYKPLIILLLLATQSYAQTFFDPLAIGVGARALGMGKAAVAMADEGDTLFNNPAGLGEVDHLKFSSMSGNLLEEVNYAVLGGVYPLGQQSAIGLGYAGAFVTGIELRDAGGQFSRKANFGDAVILLALGKKFNNNTSLGVSVKYFFSDGTEINAGDGQGWNLDVGLLQKGQEWLSLGVVGQNLLPAGKVNYQNGGSEPVEARIKAGSTIYLLGGGYDAAFFAPVELSAALDASVNPRQPNGLTLQCGLELSPNPLLTVRAGLDGSSPTAGLSLKAAGVGFHYAYHPYGDFTENASHFFSLSYDARGAPPENPSDVYLGCK